MSAYEDPRAAVRRLMAGYKQTPAETGRRLDALLAGEDPDEPGPAELAAQVLGQYGFTADDIKAALADGGKISVTFVTDETAELAADPGAADVLRDALRKGRRP